MGENQDRGYELLENDSLLSYSRLLLVEPKRDSLDAHRLSNLDRFVAAGGTVALRGGDLHELDWDRGAVAGATTGRVRAFPKETPDEELRAFFTSVPAPAPADAQKLPAPAPHDDRFRIEILDQSIYEPMEMEVLPHGDVLFLERRGKMKVYDASRRQTRLVHDFAVCTEGNYEDGLHGVALDPQYGKENHHIFVYYSPAPCDSTDQFLSRFDYRDGQLDTTSEVVVLRVKVQRKSCCHSGGSIEFGPDGLLYLSTGDNTSSKESDGYSPLDERPGRSPYDSQKGSSNTHDLRGKILRIRPLADGSYEIPEGNLFPTDGSDGRPEVYVMGARNPFRIAIDPWSNYLYWGDVGPDVGEPGRYGPQSYDEWNQARTPGNYGWPYFVGDNYAYPRRDFATDEVGELFDPQKPINNSPNNTGRRVLPEARPALIWYPYGPSKEFPQLGQGSRSAMAGPFYNTDDLLPITNRALPDYYHGKWFIYEWARSWIKVVTLDSARQEIVRIEDFLPDFPISKPIDFKIGPDGAIYLLEYGNNYFMNNPDARLVRISYSDRNRPPVAQLAIDETAGGLPFRPTLSAAASFDPDPEDSLTFSWYVNGGLVGQGATITPTINRPGDHTIRLVATDRTGATAEALQEVQAGNARPTLDVALAANRSFLLPGYESLTYTTTVDDPEDRAAGRLAPSQTLVNALWIDDPTLAEDLRRGRRQLPAGDLKYAAGESLIAASDCYTCHQERAENVGPAYLAVAERYDDTPANIEMLARKVIKGGNGNWGERLMSGHPTLSPTDAEVMVGYILSLNNGSRLPLRGTVRPGTPNGAAYVLAASYRDGGGLVGQHVTVLRRPQLEAEDAFDRFYRAEVPGSGQQHAFEGVDFRPGGQAWMEDIDLWGVTAVRLRLHAWQTGELALRRGGPDGELIDAVVVEEHQPWDRMVEVSLGVPREFRDREPGDLVFVWKGEGGVVEDDMGHHRPGNLGWVDSIEFVSGVAR